MQGTLRWHRCPDVCTWAAATFRQVVQRLSNIILSFPCRTPRQTQPAATALPGGPKPHDVKTYHSRPPSSTAPSSRSDALVARCKSFCRGQNSTLQYLMWATGTWLNKHHSPLWQCTKLIIVWCICHLCSGRKTKVLYCRRYICVSRRDFCRLKTECAHVSKSPDALFTEVLQKTASTPRLHLIYLKKQTR